MLLVQNLVLKIYVYHKYFQRFMSIINIIKGLSSS